MAGTRRWCWPRPSASRRSSKQGGARDVLVADGREKQAEILALRSAMYEALRPAVVELFDISVPRSQIAGHVERVHRLEQELGIQLPTYGHAADGNVHTHSLRRSVEDGVIGAEVPGWRETHEKVRAALFEDAVARGGVISGEHGIGLREAGVPVAHGGPRGPGHDARRQARAGSRRDSQPRQDPRLTRAKRSDRSGAQIACALCVSAGAGRGAVPSRGWRTSRGIVPGTGSASRPCCRSPAA